MNLKEISELSNDIKEGDLADILEKTEDKVMVVATGYSLPYIQSKSSMAAYEFSSGPKGPKSFSVLPFTTIFGSPGKIGSLKFRGQKECVKVTHYRIRERVTTL